jgi:hypothetical protein
MSRQSRTKLAPPKTEPEKIQTLDTLEEFSAPEQIEKSLLSELDMEIECARCSDIMALCSSFDKLVYSCDSCNFVLKCI